MPGHDAAEQGRGGKLRVALALLREPDACQGGAQPEDGGRWFLAGQEWESNPRLTLPPSYLHFVNVWAMCRGGTGGYSSLPSAGGMNDQAAWTMHAFRILANAEADMAKRD